MKQAEAELLVPALDGGDCSTLRQVVVATESMIVCYVFLIL